jgi:hypothetical protein
MSSTSTPSLHGPSHQDRRNREPPAMTESATMPIDHKLWRIEFGVEVSTLYRDWRRSFLGTLVNVVRAVALISAVISLGSGFVTVTHGTMIVAFAGGLAAVVTLADLVFQFDARARLHDDLYRRFKALQAEIARHSADADKYLSQWDAAAQEIRVNEPPVYWSIYAACWNQVAERIRAPKEYVRSLDPWKAWAGKYLFVHFRPGDFPAEA